MKNKPERSVSGIKRVARRTLPLLRGMFICPEPIKKWNPDLYDKAEEDPLINSHYMEWLLREG
jgi:hypothetical protein